MPAIQARRPQPLQRPVRERRPKRPEQEPFHLTARHFHSFQGFEGRCAPEKRKRFQSNGPRQNTGIANPGVPHVLDIVEGIGKSLESQSQPAFEHRTAALWLAKQRSRIGALGVQLVGGQIATAKAQIGGHVAQDVDQLQTASKVIAKPGHRFEIEAGVAAHMPETEPRPELADAAGDEPRVSVQLGGALQGAYPLTRGKAKHVELLAVR